MGEFNAVILSVLLVVAIFAAVMIPLSNMYTGLVDSISDEITEVTKQANDIIDENFTDEEEGDPENQN